ncbi:MAG: hypothetical protein WCZ20_03525 [Hydrogenophaga sp.]
MAVTEAEAFFWGSFGAAATVLAFWLVLVLDTAGARLDFFAGMRTSKKRQERNRQGHTKQRQNAPGRRSGGFVAHDARLRPEKAGLQASGAIIWCAVLAVRPLVSSVDARVAG